MNESEEVKVINFGIFDDFIMSKGSMCFHSVLKINEFEYLSCASKQIIKFERDRIKKIYNIPSVCATYLPYYDAIIIISPPPTKMSIYFGDQLNEPIIQDINIDQVGICHMVWSERNRTLITFGIGVSTFLIEMVPKINRIAKYDIWARVTFLKHFAIGYRANLLSNPCWIETKNELVIPLKEGLMRYTLDGEMKGSPVSLNSDKFTLYLYNEHNKKALTSDADQGLCLWNKHGRMTHHYTCISTPIFVAFYLTNEFLIAYDSSMYLSIIDIKTERYFPMVKLYPRPDKIFFDRSYGQVTRVIVSSQNLVKVYKVIIPWHLWKRTSTTPKLILRCPRANGAARIGVLLSDASIQFYSPVSRKMLTLCHAREVGFPSCILPDRGMLNVVQRDQLFVTFDNGKTAIFGTNQPLLEPVVTLENKATCCVLSMFQEKWCLLIGTKTGDILVYTYDKLQFMKRFGKERLKVEQIYHHDKTNSIFVVYQNKFSRYDSVSGTKTDEYSYEYGCIGAVIGDMLIFGYENGSFLIHKIEDKKLTCLHHKGRPLHIGRVTGLTGGNSFFVSSGLDGSCLIWTMKNCEVVIQIKFPLPIFSVAFLNGKRGLLVGTDSEIMIVNGQSLFGKNVDPEDPLFDNFDKKVDAFDNGTLTLLEDENDNCEEEDLGFLDQISARARKEREEQEKMMSNLTINTNWSDKIPDVREVTVKKPETKNKKELTDEELNALKEINELNGEKTSNSNTYSNSNNSKDENENKDGINVKNKSSKNDDEYEEEYEEDENENFDGNIAKNSKFQDENDDRNKSDKNDNDDNDSMKLSATEDLTLSKDLFKTSESDDDRSSLQNNTKVNYILPKTIKNGLQQPSSRYNKSLDSKNKSESLSKANRSKKDENSSDDDFDVDDSENTKSNNRNLNTNNDKSSSKNKDGKSSPKSKRKSKKAKNSGSNTDNNFSSNTTHSSKSNKQDEEEDGRKSARRQKNSLAENYISSKRNISSYEDSNLISRVIENDKIPEYPNVAIRPRSPRKVYIKEKSKISPDFNAAEHLAPQIYFDRDTITKLVEEEKPENLTVMRKLSCFNQSLGDFDENSKHFVLSKPKNIFGTTETENGEFVTVLPLKEDPPHLVEVPPFIQQERDEPNFIIPPIEEDIPASSKVYPPCPSSPRGQRPHSPSVRKRREFLNSLTASAETNQNVSANEFQKPKIINPSTSIGKTRFGSLVKLFSQVHKKKNRNSMKSFV